MLRKIYIWGVEKIGSLLVSADTATHPTNVHTQITYEGSRLEQQRISQNCIDQALKQWNREDILSLKNINFDDLNDHPNRAHLALAIGAAHQHIGKSKAAVSFIMLARKWGCSRQEIAQLLLTEACNSIVRARKLVRNIDLNCRPITRLSLAHLSESNENYLGFQVKEYWDERYQNGGNSGFGSYGRLAEFKAGVINNFVGDKKIGRIIEFGCGDGNQLSMFNVNSYSGVDISPTAIMMCRRKFEDDPKKKFLTLAEFTAMPFKAELTLSLDVIFHLVEDDVFSNYMTMLLDTSERFCIIYASDSDDRVDPAVHVRHRKFSRWIKKNRPNWRLVNKIYNDFPHDGSINPKDLSFSNFYFYEKFDDIRYHGAAPIKN